MPGTSGACAQCCGDSSIPSPLSLSTSTRSLACTMPPTCPHGRSMCTTLRPCHSLTTPRSSACTTTPTLLSCARKRVLCAALCWMSSRVWCQRAGNGLLMRLVYMVVMGVWLWVCIYPCGGWGVWLCVFVGVAVRSMLHIIPYLIICLILPCTCLFCAKLDCLRDG